MGRSLTVVEMSAKTKRLLRDFAHFPDSREATDVKFDKTRVDGKEPHAKTQRRKGRRKMSENELAHTAVDIAFRIHNRLGPGLLESVYEAVLLYELRKRGLSAEKQVAVPVVWEEVQLEIGFRADIIVEAKLILELKACESIEPVHKKQLLIYLRLTGCQLGLLINFNVPLIKNGITRAVNNLSE
jgi:GxxExxY protein